MSTTWYFVTIAVLIGLSAFFSASEMAFSSANRLRLENAMEVGSRKARMACWICDRYDDALSTILIGNNLVNIASSSIATVLAIKLVGEQYTAIATALITILVIIFGETMPKIVAKKNANRFAPGVAYIVRALMFVLKPVVLVVVGLVHLITKPLKGEAQNGEEEAVEELVSLIETVEDEGVIDEDRSELLQAAIDFSDVSSSEAMTSRVDMIALDIDDDWEEILKTVDEAPYSRLPVYEDSADHMIGILYLNHFFKALTEGVPVDIRPLLMEPCYVYKTVKLPDVLEELRRCKQHMAIVTDDYGGTMGIITMEDVLEEIVGEIWDETDEVINDMVERSHGVYEVDGDMSIYDFLEELDISEDDFETESATVGGWTLESFGGFPLVGDAVENQGFKITVLEMDAQRVEKVLVEALDHRRKNK